MRIAFAGTPEFARVALERLLAADIDVKLVLSQPDRPAGRGLKLQPSPVKALALERGLSVAQPQGLGLDGRFAQDAAAARAALQAAHVDVLVVVAYGLILPAWLLELPPLGCLNIHASLLPRWRGAAPIHRAIEAGDALTGVTIMQMDGGLDTGDMLLAEAEPIRPDDTTASLHDRLAAVGARLIVQALGEAAGCRLQRTPQADGGATYAHKIAKTEAPVDWSRPAAAIERRLRAFDPFPGATFQLDGRTVKLWRAQLAEGGGEPGTVLRADDRLVVACGDGALALEQLQRPGGKRVGPREFLSAEPGLRPGLSLAGASSGGH
jgi:methionyl-tRNA formyltransferase